MATGKALNGKPYAGNPHVRFDEGAGASRHSGRSALLYKKHIVLMLAALLLCGGCHPQVPQPENRPWEPDTPVPAAHDGVFRSDHGTMRFDGDGESVEIDFDAELAALARLPKGARKGTYEFLSGELPPHGSLPVRYDVAHELRISTGWRSSVVKLGLAQEDGKSFRSGTGTVTGTRIPLVFSVDGRFRTILFLKEGAEE